VTTVSPPRCASATAAGQVSGISQHDDFRRDVGAPGPSTETGHQRSVGVALGLGALVVLLLMVLAASGATHALWP
jgi:hypothetical protein